MALAREIPVAAIAGTIGEHHTRVWRIIHHYVDEARQGSDFSEIKAVAVGKIASRQGHNYISLFLMLRADGFFLGLRGGSEYGGGFR